MKRLLSFIVLWTACVAIHAGTGLVSEHVRTSQVMLFDNYFNSCRAALVVGEDLSSGATILLALTLEDADMTMNKGDEVVLGLRGGKTVALHCVDDVRRGDIHMRRFKSTTLQSFTIYLRLTPQQLTLLLENDCRTIKFKNAHGEVSRKLKDTKPKFASLARELTDGGVKF